jgi:Putative beta-barrel porin-2, OmpL-like. bbp2
MRSLGLLNALTAILRMSTMSLRYPVAIAALFLFQAPLFGQTPAPINPSKPPSFFKRLGRAYLDDWHPGPAPSPAPNAPPDHRGYAAPVSNPPYPFIQWPMGGTPWIGYPNSTQYPLTVALQTGPHGDWWKKANVQLYGWFDLGMNVSTSHTGPYANAPAAYAQVANSFVLDQATFYIERVPDTIQTDHFDWGFRLTNLYGFDYRFTTAEGYFSQQLLNNPKTNGTLGNKYGYDPVMAYVDLYFPHVAEGMDVRIGRYISLPDIEAQLAPNNYTYTHSLTYTYDCYTQTGINASIKLSNHWTVQGGLSGGCEAAPWAPDAKLTGNVCVAYTWSKGGDEIYLCANSLNDSKYSYNNLAAYYATWYHKFGDSKWHMDWETWYQYMKDTPNVNNPAAAHLLLTNSNGAVCTSLAQLTCNAPEYASVVYATRQLSKKDAIIGRTEYFDDLRGQRTGYRSKYSESTISWNHWIGSTIVFRPEIRYDHAFNALAYDSGTKKSQLMFAADMILFY